MWNTFDSSLFTSHSVRIVKTNDKSKRVRSSDYSAPIHFEWAHIIVKMKKMMMMMSMKERRKRRRRIRKKNAITSEYEYD